MSRANMERSGPKVGRVGVKKGREGQRAEMYMMGRVHHWVELVWVGWVLSFPNILGPVKISE